MESQVGTVRIGELSRRLGVSDHVLRAWERRYGLLRPVRSAGGFRLYSEADERRVRRMQSYLDNGLSAAEAARAALADDAPRPPIATPVQYRDGLTDAGRALAHALEHLDEPAAQAVFDRLFAEFTVETVLRDVVVPHLHELGERWARGEASVADEHFASNVIRGRLASLARGWGHGRGPRAVLACAPGELHDLALLAFGIVLNRNGWRVDYLGADTPVEDLAGAAAQLGVDVAVLTAVTPERFEAITAQLTDLATTVPVFLAGAGATRAVADASGATVLDGDPVTAAERMLPPVS